MSQGQDPSGFAKYAPHVAYGHDPCHSGKASYMSMQNFPKSIIFPPENGGKDAFGAEKDQPIQENNPHLILPARSTITEPLEAPAPGVAGDVSKGA